GGRGSAPVHLGRAPVQGDGERGDRHHGRAGTAHARATHAAGRRVALSGEARRPQPRRGVVNKCPPVAAGGLFGESLLLGVLHQILPALVREGSQADVRAAARTATAGTRRGGTGRGSIHGRELELLERIGLRRVDLHFL